MKISAFVIVELMEHSLETALEESNENGHVAHYYKRTLTLLRRINEYLAFKRLYTRRWMHSDMLILLSPFCSCCDEGFNMAKTIGYVRKKGYSGNIIALLHMHSATRYQPYELPRLNNLYESDCNIICLDLGSETAFRGICKCINSQ